MISYEIDCKDTNIFQYGENYFTLCGDKGNNAEGFTLIITMKGLEQYDVKLLLALVKSVGGRTDFFKVLVEGPHPELAAFSNAIRGDDDAMVWLFKHNYAWLAILSNACDGDEKAQEWVQKNLTKVNMMYALAARRNIPAVKWLLSHRLEIFLMLARETEKFLDYQDKEYAWPYVMHFGGHTRAAEELTEWKKQQDNDTEERQQTEQGKQGREED